MVHVARCCARPRTTLLYLGSQFHGGDASPAMPIGSGGLAAINGYVPGRAGLRPDTTTRSPLPRARPGWQVLGVFP